MSRQIEYVCDRCKTLIVTGRYKMVVTGRSSVDDSKLRERYDLCAECMRQVRRATKRGRNEAR